MSDSSHLRRKCFHFLYVNVFKRIVFLIDPEVVHDVTILLGRVLGAHAFLRKFIAWLFHYRNPILSQNIKGISFQNPVGLSAGFDKNALLTDILPDVGFGFMELGSITGEKCEGNPKPRLWRLKKSKSILVYYGLVNDGAQAIAARLRGKKFRIPVGINIAKTNNRETVEMEAGTRDYLKAYQEMADIGDYDVLNVSCPNAYGGCPFTQAANLEHLLSKVGELPKNKPIFLKISPDLTEAEIDDIIALSRKFGVDGFVCSNLTKRRENPNIVEKKIPEVGGMSGKVVEKLSDELIERIYRKAGKEFVIIGVGGIFSAEDAYRKIRKGASLVELITGMIFEGPQLVGEINYGLAGLLRRDGFASVSEAVGIDSR